MATSGVTFQTGGVAYTAYETRTATGVTGATPSVSSDASPGSGGLVLVCHENRGPTEHIRDATRRLSVAGYVALAIDLLSPGGGTGAQADPSAIPSILTRGDFNRHGNAIKDAILYYDSTSDPAAVTLAMIVVCFSGGVTWQTATREPRWLALIPSYGPPPPLDALLNITAAVLGVYSDDVANEGREELVAALEVAGMTHDIRVYPGTEHAFHNDTSPGYNPEQATSARTDTPAWLGR